MSDLRNVQRFLDDYRNEYLGLLRRIKHTCEELQQKLGPSIVDDIYTRQDSTHGSSEFKEAAKIAGKLRQRGYPVNAASCLLLNDIVGLTMVLQYPDDVDDVIGELRSSLSRQGIETSDPERHENKNGYFATHLVCTGGAGASVRCEIQIKTILHDAWSAKMHDLTYKPMGALDPRHEELMASIAATIESLENQSTLVRRMIKAGWNVEEEARRRARRSLFDMVGYREILQGTLAKKGEILALCDRIEQAHGIIGEKPLGDPEIEAVRQAVDAVCRERETLRQGWMMAGRIASLRPLQDLVLFFIPHADAWLDWAPQQLTDGNINDREISAVPSMFYVIGDLDRAIDYAEDILNRPLSSQLTDERKARIRFNRAVYLTEREYHAPTRHQKSREALKQEIDAALDATAALGLADLASSVLDARGFAKITFATSKNEVRVGIAECTEARTMDEAADDMSDAYCELNVRLGWRRYFELETIIEQKPLPILPAGT